MGARSTSAMGTPPKLMTSLSPALRGRQFLYKNTADFAIGVGCRQHRLGANHFAHGRIRHRIGLQNRLKIAVRLAMLMTLMERRRRENPERRKASKTRLAGKDGSQIQMVLVPDGKTHGGMFGCLQAQEGVRTAVRTGTYRGQTAQAEATFTRVDAPAPIENGEMKNIQVIDDAINTRYSIYCSTEEDFALIFPNKDQDIEFADEFFARHNDNLPQRVMERIWERPVDKKAVSGIHGTLFYNLPEKKKFYIDKKEPPIDWKLVP